MGGSAGDRLLYQLKIKYFRRVFSRYDKTAQAYMAFLNVVAIDIWLR